MSIATVFTFGAGLKIIDIGTGGGFPGIPLAIFFPEARFHLVDSIAKKLKAVDAIVESIGLKNVTTEHIRAEQMTPHRQQFHFALSRGVAPLKDLWRWSKPLLANKMPVNYIPEPGEEIKRPGLICLKGGDLAVEIQESGTRPWVTEISGIFSEEFFKDKLLLYVPK